MKRRQYSTLSDWFKDMELVFDNAMEYNEPGSRVYRDAKLLLVSQKICTMRAPYTHMSLASTQSHQGENIIKRGHSVDTRTSCVESIIGRSTL